MSESRPYCTQHGQPLERCGHHIPLTDVPEGAQLSEVFPDATGRLLQAIFAAPEPGPPFTHTLKLPETEEEMAEPPGPSFTLEDGRSVMDLLLQECRRLPDWYHVSRQHWVMNLGWYKRVRREVNMHIPGAEQDEDKWVPGPDDTIFGYPIEVREDGGEPHLVSDHQDGP